MYLWYFATPKAHGPNRARAGAWRERSIEDTQNFPGASRPLTMSFAAKKGWASWRRKHLLPEKEVKWSEPQWFEVGFFLSLFWFRGLRFVCLFLSLSLSLSGFCEVVVFPPPPAGSVLGVDRPRQAMGRGPNVCKERSSKLIAGQSDYGPRIQVEPVPFWRAGARSKV